MFLLLVHSYSVSVKTKNSVLFLQFVRLHTDTHTVSAQRLRYSQNGHATDARRHCRIDAFGRTHILVPKNRNCIQQLHTHTQRQASRTILHMHLYVHCAIVDLFFSFSNSCIDEYGVSFDSPFVSTSVHVEMESN